MDNSDEKRHEQPPLSQRREISIGIVIPTAALVFTLFTFGHSLYVGMLDRIMAIDSLVASNTTAHFKRDTELEHFSARFAKLENRVDECSETVSELRAVSRIGSRHYADE